MYKETIEELHSTISELESELAYMQEEANRLNREIEDLKTRNHRLLDQISRREW